LLAEVGMPFDNERAAAVLGVNDPVAESLEGEVRDEADDGEIETAVLFCVEDVRIGTVVMVDTCLCPLVRAVCC